MIRFLPEQADLAGIAADARAEGRDVHVVVASPEKAAAIESFRVALGFPRWAGHNLDALADSLDDWLRVHPGPVELVWEGTAALRSLDPTAYESIAEILTEASEAHPASQFTVIER